MTPMPIQPRLWLAVLMLAAPASILAGAARAEDATVSITIKDHKFTPEEVRIPAGKPVILKIKNEDSSAEEFESHQLKVEKVIAAGKEGTVRLSPQKPGRYPFIGEFHAGTAKGVVIVE